MFTAHADASKELGDFMRTTFQTIAIGITIFGTACLWHEASARPIQDQTNAVSPVSRELLLRSAEVHSVAGAARALRSDQGRAAAEEIVQDHFASG